MNIKHKLLCNTHYQNIFSITKNILILKLNYTVTYNFYFKGARKEGKNLAKTCECKKKERKSKK